jgi:hypothetical protein
MDLLYRDPVPAGEANRYVNRLPGRGCSRALRR